MADTPNRGIFIVEGEEIPFPDFASEGFTMDEAMVFYDYTGFPIEDLGVDDDMDPEELEQVQLKTRSPHVLSALMHIGYGRAHPKAKQANIRKLVKSTSFVVALSRLGETDEGDDSDDPPSVESTSKLNESSTSTPVGSENTNAELSEKPGSSSLNGSSEPGNHPAPTGVGSSDTSSQGSDQTTSDPSGHPI